MGGLESRKCTQGHILLTILCSHAHVCIYIYVTYFSQGVEFGARMINIDGKQIKLQIWDTVSYVHVYLICEYTD